MFKRRLRPKLVVTCSDGTLVARVTQCDRLTEDTLAVIGPELAALPDTNAAVVLDLGEVEFAGSTAVATLLRLHRRAKAAGGRLTLTNLRPAVRAVFAVTHLDTFLDVRPAAEKAG